MFSNRPGPHPAGVSISLLESQEVTVPKDNEKSAGSGYREKGTELPEHRADRASRLLITRTHICVGSRTIVKLVAVSFE